MKPTFLLSALLSCFVIQGNAQESVPATAPTNSYATQGNVSQNRSIYDQEMQRAAVEARKMKELKAAIASQSFGPPPATITTASQFLAANPPAVPPAPQSSEVERSAAYVPEFDNPETSSSAGSTPSRPVESSGAVPDFELPEKQERSFFKWLKNKKDEPEFEGLPPAGASRYEQNPYESPATNSSPPEPAPPATSNGIPDVPAMNDSVPAPPAPPSAGENSAPASIFVKRDNGAPAAAETATVEKDSEAVVNGVIVKLYAGTQVTVLSKTVSEATVRLPDGRVGSVKRRSLSR
ncbi:MAG: hypothetical protein AAGF67_00030 [Verrucomicrobiota bacterium]